MYHGILDQTRKSCAGWNIAEGDVYDEDDEDDRMLRMLRMLCFCVAVKLVACVIGSASHLTSGMITKKRRLRISFEAYHPLWD